MLPVKDSVQLHTRVRKDWKKVIERRAATLGVDQVHVFDEFLTRGISSLAMKNKRNARKVTRKVTKKARRK